MKVAVIGSGISGLASAWLLLHGACDKNAPDVAEVHLFEAGERLGGHAWTTERDDVDVGFQVFNFTTYPHLVGLFKELGIESVESEMSFSCSLDQGEFEWASHGLSSFFGGTEHWWLQTPSKLSERVSLLRDVLRFGREAAKASFADDAMTLGKYLEEHNYSDIFRQMYIRPVIAAIWSVPNATAEDFPMISLQRFFNNHHLFTTVGPRPVWRVIKGRSRRYVDKIEEMLLSSGKVTIHKSSPVMQLDASREGDRFDVKIGCTSGLETAEGFDSVIFATHTDVTCRILEASLNSAFEGRLQGDALRARMLAQLAVLRDVEYQTNHVVLHRDQKFMPKNENLWAAWNCLEETGADGTHGVTCTYWINRLQHVDPSLHGGKHIFVTLNPLIDPEDVLEEFSFDHPIITAKTVAAQGRVADIQGGNNIFFCGAWRYYGFHEDGITSAVDAVALVAHRHVPWTPTSLTPAVTTYQSLSFKLFDWFLRTGLTKGQLRVILPDGRDMFYGESAQDLRRWYNRQQSPVVNKPNMRDRVHTIRVYDMSFFSRLVSGGSDIVLGEVYMDGLFDVEVGTSIGDFFRVLCLNIERLSSRLSFLGPLEWFADRYNSSVHKARANTEQQTKKNISEHYDLGNEMYSMFLDPTMTYSSAVFGSEDPGLMATESLEEAQKRKLRMLLTKAEVGPGSHCLEIGGGWGSLALCALQEREVASWTMLTLSEEQKHYVEDLMAAHGYQDKVKVVLQDYRVFAREAVRKGELYDAVLSCEMIEAVGHEFLPQYFLAVRMLLKTGGKAAIQSITISDNRYDSYCRTSDFIKRYIFPGGHLPCLQVLNDACEASDQMDDDGTVLTLRHSENFGRHYAETLRRWSDAMTAKKQELWDHPKYGKRFVRLFLFYFGYCEGAFDADKIGVYHLVYQKELAALVDTTKLSRGVSWHNFLSGEVMHSRRGGAVRNRFRYPLAMSLISLKNASRAIPVNQLPNKGRHYYLQDASTATNTRDDSSADVPWYVSLNGHNIISFHATDYLDGTAGSASELAQRIREMLHKTDTNMDVKLLTMSRTLGYSFNPISVFVVGSPGQDFAGLVLEVTNTPWMEKTHYALPLSDACKIYKELDCTTWTWQFRKALHVSPFMSMDKQYTCTFLWDSSCENTSASSVDVGFRRVRVSIDVESDDASKKSPDGSFVAVMDLTPCLNDHAPAATFVMPFLAQLWIHWQAFKLLYKGATYYPKERNGESQRKLLGSEALAWSVDLVKHLAIFIFALAALLWIRSSDFLSYGIRLLLPAQVVSSSSDSDPFSRDEGKVLSRNGSRQKNVSTLKKRKVAIEGT